MYTDKQMTDASTGEVTTWRTYRSIPAGWETCSQDESLVACGMITRYLKWDNGTYTFHRAGGGTRGRTVQRGPESIWIRPRA